MIAVSVVCKGISRVQNWKEICRHNTRTATISLESPQMRLEENRSINCA